MNARSHLERLFGGPAPVEAPPKIAPTAPPKERPTTSPPPSTPGRPNPFRRKTLHPGEEPRPKMRLRAEANELLKRNDLGEFVK